MGEGGEGGREKEMTKERVRDGGETEAGGREILGRGKVKEEERERKRERQRGR